MILIPESGYDVVKSQGHLGNAGLYYSAAADHQEARERPGVYYSAATSVRLGASTAARASNASASSTRSRTRKSEA